VDNPFSWDYLTAPLSQTPTFGPFSIFYLVLFGLSFILALFMYYDGPRRFENHKLRRDMVNVASQMIMWVTAIGLIFFLIRAMRFELLTLERRFWLYLTFAIYLGMIAYFVYYVRVVYPPKLAAFEKHRARRKYTAPPSRGAARARSRRRATR
jgi:hypothetical protein